MIKQPLYFALWAEDISQYIHSGYNSKTLGAIEEALRSYVSVDETNDINHSHLSLFQIIKMTGLTLDFSESEFSFLDELSDRTLNQRKGIEAPFSLLS
jgi:putative NIF3 family GTP cyclohydrolase 1 type 2